MLDQIVHPHYEEDAFWQIDLWAAGVTLLEIAVGFPVWVNQKCIVQHNNSRNFLAFSGILNFEALLIKNGIGQMLNAQRQKFDSEEKIRLLLKKSGGAYELYNDHDFINLLWKMLQFDPTQRISPK